MPYLIDGHNLIGKHPRLSLADPDDEARLLSRLQRFGHRARRKLVVFFDQGTTPAHGESHGPLEVHFVRPPRNADEALLAYLANLRDPANWVVVTSDAALARRARARQARVIPSEAFISRLESELAGSSPREATGPSSQEVEEWLRLFEGESDLPSGGA